MAGATSGNDAPEESCEVSEISTASSWDELEGDVKDPEHRSGLGVALLLFFLLKSWTNRCNTSIALLSRAADSIIQ
jgi:hypothetical protein